MHLFDIDIPGKQTFKESDTLTAGSHLTVIDADDVKIGIGICYDLRFGELSRAYAKRGCQLLVYPGQHPTQCLLLFMMEMPPAALRGPGLQMLKAYNAFS